MPNQPRRSNAERSSATHQALISAAATLFGQHGYAATSTNAILEATALTRGALYHHFADKRALFIAVVEHVEHTLIAAIKAQTAQIEPPSQRLRIQIAQYIDAIAQPAPARILLQDAPAVIGPERWRTFADAAWQRQLSQFMQPLAAPDSAIPAILAGLVGAAIDRAALAILDGSAARAEVKQAIDLLLERLLAP